MNLIVNNDRSGLLRKADRRELLLVFGLAVMACVLRVALIPYGDFITSDGVFYATLAKNLMAGDLDRGLSTYWSPLYPLLITMFAGIFRRDPVEAGRLLSALAGGMLVIPVYFIARRFSRRKVTAVVAALFVIFDPSLVHYSLRVLTESVYTLLLIAGILIGWVALERGTSRYFFITGLVFGLAYLTRPEAMGYVFLLCLTISVVGLARKAGGLWVISRASLIVLGALLAAAPYLYYLRQETGRWTITEKFATNLPSNTTDIRKLLPDGQLTRADVAWAGTRPEPAGAQAAPATSERLDARTPTPSLLRRLGTSATYTIKGLYWEYFMISKLLPPLFLILIGVGFFAVGRTSSMIGLDLYIGSFIFATFLGYALTYRNERYLVPLIPLALCWAASGTVAAASWFHDTLGDRKLSVLRINTSGQALALVSLIVVMSQLVTIFVQIPEDSGRESTAAEWIRSQGLESPLIMATGPWAAYYSTGRHLYIPNEQLPVVLAYAKRKNVDFLVLEERWLETTPSLAPLLAAENIPPELTLVYENASAPKDLCVRVFRLSEREDQTALAGAQKTDTGNHGPSRVCRLVTPTAVEAKAVEELP